MEKVYIFGHKKPDTDSVAGAISFAYLKRKLGINAEARILSEVNKETIYALNRFGFEVPKYLNDVKVELKDIKYNKNYYANQNDSIFNVYNTFNEHGITGIPLVDDHKKFVGYVSLKELANELIIDIERYKKHPNCKTLYCFVYDPINKIKNPRGFEKDLTKNTDGLQVIVIIKP